MDEATDRELEARADAVLEALRPDAVDVVALTADHERRLGCWCQPIPTVIGGIPARLHRTRPPIVDDLAWIVRELERGT